MGPRVNFDTPGRSCMKMAYSTDGTRYVITLLLHPMASFKFFSTVIWLLKYSYYCTNIGYSHVEQVKKVSHTLWNGMTLRGKLSEFIMGFGTGRLGLCNLIQPNDSWLLVMISV